MRRLLVTGSLAYDYILGYPGHLQKSLAPLRQRDRCNITLEARKFDRYPGGCGGNISYTLALLGEQPRLLSIAGGDFQAYREQLEHVGVDLSCVRVSPLEVTASCVILTDSMHNRVVVFYGGATDQADRLDLAGAIDESIGGCLIAPDDGAAMIRFAEDARRLGLRFLFDIGSMVSSLSAEEIGTSIEGAEALFCNDYEMSILQSKMRWSLEDLLEVVPVAAVTKGEHGCTLYGRSFAPLDIPAIPLHFKPVDSTGAGDAYRAGFCYGWMRNLSWLQCGRLGSTAAAFALEAGGTQSHFFTSEDYWRRYRENFGEPDLGT